MKYKTYPNMKDSGIEWIGNIPENWEIEPVKFHVLINNKILSEDTKDSTQISYIDIGSVHEGGLIDPSEILEFSESPSRARRIISENDTILSTVRTYLKAIAFVDKKYQNNICSTGFAVITPKKDLVPKFLYSMLSSEIYIETIMANSYGVTYPAINSSIIGTFPCVLPKFEEQKQIAIYLEKETIKIDSEISKNQKLIELLKEKRQSTINQAVTKGLDPTVPMKDSGIEWIGKIPEHWEIIKLKEISDVIDPFPSHRAPPLEDIGYPYAGIGDFDINGNIIKQCRTVNKSALDEQRSRFIIKKGDIGIGRVATIGKLIWLKDNHDYCISPTLAIIKPKINPKVLFYLLESNYFQQQMIIQSTGSTRSAVGIETLRILKILRSTKLIEENQIANFLDKETTKIDLLISITQNQVEKLQEFRQSLISSAVTGKICVTN